MGYSQQQVRKAYLFLGVIIAVIAASVMLFYLQPTESRLDKCMRVFPTYTREQCEVIVNQR